MDIDYTAYLTDIVRPLAEPLGLALWGIEMLGSTRPVVRIYVDVIDTKGMDDTNTVGGGFADKPSTLFENLDAETDDALEESAPKGTKKAPRPPLPAAVSIEQCTRLSRRVGLALDVEDSFVSEWVLEVSSPGFARPFFNVEQLHPYIGQDLDVVLAAPMETWPQRKKFSGSLVAIADETFSLSLPAGANQASEASIVEIPWQYIRKVNLVHLFTAVDKKAASIKQRQEAAKH